MIRRARLAALAVLVTGAGLAAAPQTSSPQSQTPTFKLEVNYVEVDALVTDQQGNFVRGLAKNDFQVFEDGKPQDIAAFSVVDLPVEAPAPPPLGTVRPIEPDVKTNERPFNGRIYVMVIDDLHTLFGRGNRVKVAARQFIEQHLGANDLMAVLHTAGPTDASQEFTNNKRLLLAAVDRTDGRKLRSATLARTENYYNTRNQIDPGDASDPDEAERGFNAQSTLETLKNVCDWFGSVRGRRKTILFVSEGIDYDINDVFNNPHASSILDDTRDVISAATRANVSIFGIDPRGLTSLGDEDIEVQTYPDDTSLGIGSNSLQNEVRLSQDSLRVLSDETGGFATVNRNDFRTAYDRIVRDNSTYYVLAYYPPTDKRDGKYHKISVRVNRPGLTVRARKGYVSPKGKAAAPTTAGANGASPELRDAINSPLPVSGLTMRVFAAPFKGAAPNASVLLGAELRGSDLQLSASDKVELSYMAVDAQGKVRAGNTDNITMNLRPETKARVQQTGIRLLNRVDLPPGRYQIRFAARDSGGGALGAIHYDLDVPDFAKSPFSISGLVLTSARAAAEPTARPDEQLRGVLPGPPAAVRSFGQNDEIATFAEVYDNEAGSPHKVDITTSVIADDGRVVFKNDEERASSELGGRSGGYGTTARIPLKDFAPGPYVLKVEARSRLGKEATASREVQFSVEASK
jgi:VWFA-related protein